MIVIGNVGNVLTQMRTSLVPLPQCRVLLRQSRNTFIPQEDSILCGISAALPTNINCLVSYIALPSHWLIHCE